MSNQVAALSRSCFYQLHQLRAVRNSLDIEATKTLVNAFVASRLDYCNSLLAGITDGLLSKLQTIQNAAARLITRTRKFDHITPVLRDLHWLPVKSRIDFKVATLVYKCLCGEAPPYLAEYCVLKATPPGQMHLRSADLCKMHEPAVNTNYGSRSFASYGPSTWNSLSVDLRTLDCSVSEFRRKLKTYFTELLPSR